MPALNCALARLIPPTPASDAELRAMRAAAWHKQGVLVVTPDLVADSWERQLLDCIGTRLYGRRLADREDGHGQA